MYLNDVCKCTDQHSFEQDPELIQTMIGLRRDVQLVGDSPE